MRAKERESWALFQNKGWCSFLYYMSAHLLASFFLQVWTMEFVFFIIFFWNLFFIHSKSSSFSLLIEYQMKVNIVVVVISAYSLSLSLSLFCIQFLICLRYVFKWWIFSYYSSIFFWRICFNFDFFFGWWCADLYFFFLIFSIYDFIP